MAIKTGKPTRKGKGSPEPIEQATNNLERGARGEVVMLNVEMPREMRKQLKAWTVEQDTDISKVVRRLVQGLLSGEISLNG